MRPFYEHTPKNNFEKYCIVYIGGAANKTANLVKFFFSLFIFQILGSSSFLRRKITAKYAVEIKKMIFFGCVVLQNRQQIALQWLRHIMDSAAVFKRQCHHEKERSELPLVEMLHLSYQKQKHKGR